MDATEVMSENVHLRELLLSHLDIIQQQVRASFSHLLAKILHNNVITSCQKTRG